VGSDVSHVPLDVPPDVLPEEELVLVPPDDVLPEDMPPEDVAPEDVAPDDVAPDDVLPEDVLPDELPLLDPLDDPLEDVALVVGAGVVMLGALLAALDVGSLLVPFESVPVAQAMTVSPPRTHESAKAT
jgi:hypothetical protein